MIHSNRQIMRNSCDTGGEIEATTSNSSMGGADSIDGCIYPDEVIMENGVAFNVRYTGCIEVRTSMKSLDFVTRTQVARECINRVCEAAGLKSSGKRRTDKKISHFIAERPCLKNAGTNVIINVSSRALNLINVDTGEMIACHQMPRISFASGGDAETLDFLAYIAKNEDEWRACYVLECIGGQSEDLIVTIGKAFMLRYNALSRKGDMDKEYYNDLPNKLPPDHLNEDNMKEQEQQQHTVRNNHTQMSKLTQLNLKKPRDRLSSNLIDLNSPPPDHSNTKVMLNHFDGIKDNILNNITSTQPPDVFDMPPFSLSAEVQRSQLMTESWFHGAISRPVAEGLLKNDGDFLVRESQGKHGQYVLTGSANKSPKHLLLIDPEGVVRTKDRIFESISHLINYHWTNSLPIISEDSELVLRNPIIRLQTPTPSSNIHTHHHHHHHQQQQQQQHNSQHHNTHSCKE